MSAPTCGSGPSTSNSPCRTRSPGAGGARELRALGLDEDQRVALVATSSTDYLVVWMACVLAGVPVALVNPTYPGDLLAQMMDNLDPALCSPTCWTPHSPGPPICFPLQPRMARCRPGRHPRGDDRPVRPDVVHAHLRHHRVPKFCAQTHSYFLRLGRAMRRRLDLHAGDRMLAPLPLFHINPLGYGIVGALTAGADALTVAQVLRQRILAGRQRARHHARWRCTHRRSRSSSAPPRPTTPPGTSVRTMFYADGEFMTPLRHSRSRCPATAPPRPPASATLHQLAPRRRQSPADASRYGGPARADVQDRLDDDGQIHVRETRARHPVRRLLHPDGDSTRPATPTAGSPPATSVVRDE